MDSDSTLSELVEYIVKSLVDHPEEVTVNEMTESGSILLEVNVAESDMGRVIGKGGVVVNSIRTLVQVMAAKRGVRISLEVV